MQNRSTKDETASQFTAEYPQGAGKFVDSVGVDIHLGDTNSPYYSNFSTLAQQLGALGIHHVRDAVHLGQNYICDQGRQLASRGVTVSYVVDVSDQPGDLVDWANCVGNAIDSFEGPNEYDLGHPQSDTNWPATLARSQSMVWNTVKQTASLSGVKVFGPSLTSGGAYQAVGDLSSVEDFGNMHDYFGGRNPGTPGYGDGGYGSIAYNINVAKAASSSRPVASTETGWGIADADGNGDVTDYVAGKYMPRMFMESFIAHVPRTYAYEFFDGGAPPFNMFGWVRSDTLAPRYSYWAMKNLLAVLQDSNLSFDNGGPLYYSMTGDTQNVHHLLLQKSDGTIYLAMWVETPNNDPNSGQDYTIKPQHINIKMPLAPNQAYLYQYDDHMNLNPQQLSPSTKVDVTLVDTVTLLRMKW